MRYLKNTLFFLVVFALAALAWAQDDATCTIIDKNYNNSGGFDPDDFLVEDQGIVVGLDLALSTQDLDIENLILGLDQPFLVDYLSEGAGASHLFGFFFLDMDINKNGLPDFFETGPTDDLDGDGLANEDDDDDDNDGIPDSSEGPPTIGGSTVTSMPASYFRFGQTAVDNSINGDYWQFVPNSVIDDSSSDYDGYFELPGTYLYIDNDGNEVPDILQYNVGGNTIPPIGVDKDFDSYHSVFDRSFKGLLGNWSYEGTPGDTTDDKFHWSGATVFYIADDDGGSGQTNHYNNHSPYYPTVSDIDGNTDAFPDYLIYGTDDIESDLIPDILKNVVDNGDGTSTTTSKKDDRNHDLYKYRWYRSDVSGAREMVFFLVVFWNSGGSNVNTYYSKSGFNLDTPPATPSNNGASDGDGFGGWNLATHGTWGNSLNWFPRYRNASDHDSLANIIWGADWDELATQPTDGTSPVVLASPANPSVTQEWVDEFENYREDRRIIQYRALATWFNSTAVDANTVINGRYDIDMSLENDSSIIRSINNNMAHLMIGAPETTKDAWLLGWEDLFGGGDRDYEDVVFYVKREAGGQIQSLNVADGLGDEFATDADYSLSQVTFTFMDNFTDDLWDEDIPKRYINYYYRFRNADEWVPLLGGTNTRTPDLFQPENGGSTTTTSGVVSRNVTIQVTQKQTELYFKVEMSTDNVDTFKPVVKDVQINIQTLVHDFYYNGAVIPNSNISYFGSFEAPDLTWLEQKNRGHLYALQTFEHGVTALPTQLDDDQSAEKTPEAQPVADYDLQNENRTVNLYKWDAAVSLKESFSTLNEPRTIYTFTATDGINSTHAKSLTRVTLDPDTINSSVVDALDLSTTQNNGVWVDNFHDPGAAVQDKDSAALWLINWIHGYDDPMVSAGVVQSRDLDREWLLGGINRASPLVVRAPGLPYWVEATATSDIPIADRTSYLNFARSQADLETRVIIGSESGLVHCFNAGQWVGEVETGPNDEVYEWAEGHYKDEDFGTGKEVWAILAGHLLDDIKYNYTNSNPDAPGVEAKADGTGIFTIVKDSNVSDPNNQWKRIAVFIHGFQGGTQVSSGNTYTGNGLWAIDITDPDDPIPLWQRVDERVQDLINPLTMGWMEFGSGDPKWVVCYPTGGTPVPGNIPGFVLVNALDGDEILYQTVGTDPAKGIDVMLGTPALVDSDENGYVDLIVGATSQGFLFAYDTKTGTLDTENLSPNSFYLAPNVDISAGVVNIVAATSDNPLYYDEPMKPFTNTIYHYTYDGEDFDEVGTISLPANHKLFSRPKLVDFQLVVGTTTGDTFNFCDFDPLDPGNLLLYDLTKIDDADDGLEQQISNYGSILAPIVVSEGRIFAHKNTSDQEDPNEEGSTFRIPQSPNFAEAVAQVSVGEVFGLAGWQNELLKKLRDNL